MSIKVGRVPDLSYEPLYFDMGRRDIQLHQLPLASLGVALGKGKIDGGPVLLAECFRLEERYQYVAGFCLAAWERSGSMFLHSRMPFSDLRTGVTTS